MVRAVSKSATLAVVMALVVFAIAAVLWFAVPHVKALARFLRR